MSDGFSGIEELPLGKLLQVKYPKHIARKKPESLARKLKLKGHKSSQNKK